MKPLLYKRLLRDLHAVAISKNYTTWKEIQSYASKHSKYDSLTLRDIDNVSEAVKRYLKQQ